MTKKFFFEIDNAEIGFVYKKKESNLNIEFNRVSFIFFVFFIIFLIFSIHLIHLGSRNKVSIQQVDNNGYVKKIYRADILDRNGKYLVKTVSSINIGINPSQAIDKKRLLINLKYIFPKKDYLEIKKN